MTLVLEVEFLSGVAFLATGPGSPVPDWPPQPDRIFSALVAAWGAGGEDERGGRALEWLERQEPPRIAASGHSPRTAPVVFVPPNDPRSNRAKTATQVLPAKRKRQQRLFPATRPHDPVVRFYWNDIEVTDETLGALQELARNVAYVGHSASLTRCRFELLAESAAGHDDPQAAHDDPQAAHDDPQTMRGDPQATPGASRPPRPHLHAPRLKVYPGRLAELRREFAAGRRPHPGTPVQAAEAEATHWQGTFADRWLLLEHIAGRIPDLRVASVVAKTIRDAIMSGYRNIGSGDDIPEVVSGHTPDRRPTRDPHIAIVPLPFVGFPHADGHVMGFAVIPPRDSLILEDKVFLAALRRVAPIDENRGRRVMEVTSGEGTSSDRAFSIELSPAFEPPPGLRSLDPALYTRPSRTFATATPIVLDRFLKRRGEAREEEIRGLLAGACRNIGLPEPELVVADKHSALEGAPSAYPSSGEPDWMRWRLPGKLASRQLVHAVIRFPVEVRGPVLLGAGRFLGMGLCRPIDT